MTPLRQRMINDMTVRGLAENTKRSYVNSVSRLALHYGRNPERISAQEVQDYLIFLREERGLSWKSCNCARHGIRFLYRITLGLPEPHFYLPGAKTPSTLPELLNHDELVRLFSVTTNRKHGALLMTAYAAVGDGRGERGSGPSTPARRGAHRNGVLQPHGVCADRRSSPTDPGGTPPAGARSREHGPRGAKAARRIGDRIRTPTHAARTRDHARRASPRARSTPTAGPPGR